MGRRLSQNISSSYIEALNRMTSHHARRKIVAYVESYDDVFFWRAILSRYENSERYFEVMLPARTEHLNRGKKAVLASLGQNLGHDMIACVDADYDYLIQGATETSKILNGNPYVLHTYAYAIENYQCYAPSLHNICVAVTLNDHAVFDFTQYMTEYSRAIFPLFVWSIWFYRTPHYGEFTITDFLKVIETGNFAINRVPEILANLRRKVDKRVAMLQRHHPEARQSWQEVKNSIKQLGVTPETTYMFIQGHHLFNKVVLPMVQRVCDRLVRERENEISRQSLHSTQRHNELSCYTNSIADITSVLKKNPGYESAPTFARILADVESLLAQPETMSRKN